jgi:predicted RNA binding protein YcfA (HicA-like mRNA interferase family)
MKYRDLIKMLAKDGWSLDHTTGSHKQFRHPEKPGTVTVAGHANEDVPKGTLNAVLKQAELKK